MSRTFDCQPAPIDPPTLTGNKKFYFIERDMVFVTGRDFSVWLEPGELAARKDDDLARRIFPVDLFCIWAIEKRKLTRDEAHRIARGEVG